jgi:hypothetical protein
MKAEGFGRRRAGEAPGRGASPSEFGSGASEPDASRSRLSHPLCASLNLEQPVNGLPKVMPPLIPVVMPVILVGVVATRVVAARVVVATRVVATRVVATLVIATRVVAIGVIAIRVVDIRIGINISHLIPLRVGWNAPPH